MMKLLVVVASTVTLLVSTFLYFIAGQVYGRTLKTQTEFRRKRLLEKMEASIGKEGPDKETASLSLETKGYAFDGFVGFFHPFWYVFPPSLPPSTFGIWQD